MHLCVCILVYGGLNLTQSVFKLLVLFNEAGSLTEPGVPILVSQVSHLALGLSCVCLPSLQVTCG